MVGDAGGVQRRSARAGNPARRHHGQQGRWRAAADAGLVGPRSSPRRRCCFWRWRHRLVRESCSPGARALCRAACSFRKPCAHMTGDPERGEGSLRVRTELLRATIFHTPESPFTRDFHGTGAALVCHQDGGLLLRGGRVIACGDYGQVRRENPEAGTTDWRGGFLVPGFVDAHVHYPQLRVIGALGRSLLDWLEHVALPEEARMADVSYAAAVARDFTRALACQGTTTALAFGAHFAPATAELFESAATSGLRIVSGLVVSDRLLRADLHSTPEEAYRDSTALIRRYHKSGRLLYAVTPRFAFSTTETMLEVCQTLLAEHPDVRLQTHINENTNEVDELKTMFPWAKDYLAIYERYSLSGSRSVMAHNLHATDSELERLAAAGTSIAHCPASNAMLGSGMFPLRRHVSAGVKCALGTDVGGGVGFGMLKEGLQAYLMQPLLPDAVPLDAS